MIFLLLLQAVRFGHPGDPVVAYKNCMAPTVWANERAAEKSYQSLEVILGRIKVQCARERERVAEQILGQIVHQDPDMSPPPRLEEAEQVMDSETIRWVSDVIARMPRDEK